MTDWKQYVSRRVTFSTLPPARAAEVIEELAELLEDTYQAARQSGLSHEQAIAAAKGQLPDGADLAQSIEEAEHPISARVPSALHADSIDDRLLTWTRGVFMSALINDARYGFRMLLRNPAFSTLAILTLALGLGVNVAVFGVVEAAVLRPLAYPQPQQLVILRHRDVKTGFSKEFIAIGDYVDIINRQSIFNSAGGYGSMRGTIRGQGEPFRVRGLSATSGALVALGMKTVLGRGIQAEDSRPGAAPVMMLGYDLWQSHFGGDLGIIGKGITIDRKKLQVIGIAAPGFTFPPKATTDFIVPLEVPVAPPADRKSDWTFAVARLKPGMTINEAGANLSSISNQLQREYPASNAGSIYYPVALRDSLVGDVRPALLMMMMAAVAVVLMIACLNVANLTAARSVARIPEMTLRLALGAGKTRLGQQLLVESLLLSVVAGGVAVVIAHWTTPALVHLIPKSLSSALPDIRVNLAVLAFAVAACLATTLAVGVVSAITVRTGNLASTLTGSARSSAGPKSRGLTVTLVTAEISLAIVLLMAATLILRSFGRLLSIDPGFNTSKVLTVSVAIPEDRYPSVDARASFYRRALATLEEIPGVQHAGGAVVTPLTGNHWTIGFQRADQPTAKGERPPEVGWQAATGGYFKALQIPLLSGRLFDERDRPGGKLVVIISATIQHRFFPHEDPVGREIRAGDGVAEIVGVVGDIRRAGLRETPHEDMHFSAEQRPDTALTFFVRSVSDPSGQFGVVQSALQSIEPDAVFSEQNTLAELASESVGDTQLALWLLGIFATTALVLSTVGVYGVMSYTVRRRASEIGTRVALGASKLDIVCMLMKEGLRIASVGAAVGLVLGLIAAKSIASLLYEVNLADPLTLLISAAVLIATTLAACCLPALRAACTDPVRTLSEP